jgi:RND family efflux transporter MFP subunit
MRLPRTRSLIAAAVVVVGVPVAYLLARPPETTDASVVAQATRGEFKVTVTTSGELRAIKFVQINVPQNAQQANQYQMKISSIVPEGTVVKEGDVVAELDRSGIASRASDVSLALQKAQAVYEQAMLDSTLNLSKAREDMRTMELTLEEKKLAKEQSVYEAPTVRRQAEIDLEKAQRALAQAKLDYKTRTEQAQAKMREVGADRDRQKNLLTVVQDVMANFTIRAPAPGMVTYVKEWNGKKKTTGSQVNAWEPAVATLPDLTQMESITYVNEIDVRKIAVGQKAELSLDSDPSKRLKGKVTSVANMGEQRPNQDSKVFEVRILIEEADTTLRPGMTTGNAIETLSISDVLSIPLEAVSSDAGVTFVYKQSGSRVVKQEVATGAMNDDEVVISRGLEEGDRVLLSPPEGKENLELVRLPGSETPPRAGGDTAIGARPISPAPAPAPAGPPAAPKKP